MGTLRQTPAQTPHRTSPSATPSRAAAHPTNHEENPGVRFQRTIGNQTVSRLVPSHSEQDPGALPGRHGTATLPMVHEVLNSPGQPLDSATRAFMEPRFGHDFSGVRVHADRKAAESAGAVGAVAYTLGQQIVFAHGQPSPQTIAGRHLWAHELAHVIQQSRGGSPPDLHPSAPHEQDAHSAALAVAMELPSPRITCNTGTGLARETRSRAEIVQELHAAEEALEDHLGVARDLILREGVELESKHAVKPWRPDVVRPSSPIKDVKEQLKRIAGNPSSSHTAKAKELLDEIETVHERTKDLNRELREGTTAFKSGGGTGESGEKVNEPREPHAKGTASEAHASEPVADPTPAKSAPSGVKASAATEAGTSEARAASTEASGLSADVKAVSAEVKTAHTYSSFPGLPKIGALDAVFFYLNIHAPHFAALEAVSAKVEIAKDLLNRVDEFEKGARELREVVDNLRTAESNLPAEPLADSADPRLTVDELSHVRAYYQTAARILSDAWDAKGKLQRIIMGWDAVVDQAKETRDFTRASAWDAVTQLDFRFSKGANGFRNYLVETRDWAERVESWTRLKMNGVANIACVKEGPAGYMVCLANAVAKGWVR